MEQAKHISLVDTAKLIRRVLAEDYPGVKFSVRSKPYSGGSSIDIEYAGYPSIGEIEGIGNMYEGAGFDSMTDSKYFRTHWLLPDGSTIIARQEERYGFEGIENPKPSPDAIHVSFGVDFVFARKKEGEACRPLSEPADPREFTVIRGPKKTSQKSSVREPLDISEILKKYRGNNICVEGESKSALSRYDEHDPASRSCRSQ